MSDSRYSRRFPGAYVAEGAAIGRNSSILPGCVVGAAVNIGSECRIGPNTTIDGDVTLGSNVIIMPGAVIGMPCRQRVWPDESPKTPCSDPMIAIGNNVIVHEGVTIRLPMRHSTTVEDHVAIGAKSHVAHDCVIRQDVLIAANCLLGGYVTLGRSASLGLGVAIHPRTVIGAHSICGVGAAVVRHVAPGATVAGVPARYLHPNRRGLQRHGFSIDEIRLVCDLLSGERVHPRGRIGMVFRTFEEDIARWGRNLGMIPSRVFGS